MTRFVAWTLSLIMGCTSIGPGKLVPTHEGYNDAVQLAMTREVLKNIVRETRVVCEDKNPGLRRGGRQATLLSNCNSA